MKSPKACCGKAPLIFTGKSALGKPVYSVVCMKCSWDAMSGDKEEAIHKFNKGAKREAVA